MTDQLLPVRQCSVSQLCVVVVGLVQPAVGRQRRRRVAHANEICDAMTCCDRGTNEREENEAPAAADLTYKGLKGMGEKYAAGLLLGLDCGKGKVHMVYQDRIIAVIRWW